MTTVKSADTTQHGGIFFYILLGCALFAALTYAVTQSLRINSGSGGNVSDLEKASLSVSDITQYMESLKMKVAELTVANGIPESSLDFKNNVYTLQNAANNSDNTNATCSDSSCRIFMPYNTSGLLPRIFSDVASTTDQSSATAPKNGHGQITQISIDGVGSSAPDLVFVIYGVTATFCNSYNNRLSIITTYSDTTTLTSIGESSPGSVPASFAGSFNTTNTFATGATIFAGKKTFCAPALPDGNSPRLGIWQVLKIR